MIFQDKQADGIYRDVENFQSRLERAIEYLGNRATLNLSIGIITTFLAALGLVYVAFTPHDAFSDWVRVLEYYIPRLSLVIFVEIFAYFFLRLYKSNLDDVKYYQNELINIDAKVLALRSAIMMKDAVLIKSVSEILAKTERNYVLKKGETTTDLELARIESKVSASILDRFSNLANMFSKSRSG